VTRSHAIGRKTSVNGPPISSQSKKLTSCRKSAGCSARRCRWAASR
jgi:hypothetical protein